MSNLRKFEDRSATAWLATTGTGTGNNATVFIRKTMTPIYRGIYSAALNPRKNGQLKYLWIKEGKNFCKK